MPGCGIGALPAFGGRSGDLAFSSALPEKNFKRFLNYEWFTLSPAQVVYSRHNIAWDVKRMRRLFWHEMEQVDPESYLSHGNRLMFVTRNSGLFSSVLRGLSHFRYTMKPSFSFETQAVERYTLIQ